MQQGRVTGNWGAPKVVILTTGLAANAPKIVAVKEDKPASDSAPGEHGKAVFTQYCSACHGAPGEGSVGPSLKDEPSRKSLDQVVAFIKEPKAPMPKLFPAPLSEQDLAAVAAFHAVG